MLGGGLGCVESLERAVMAFVETPRSALRDPHRLHDVEGDPCRADGAFQQRGVGEIEFELLRVHEATGLFCLVAAAFAEVDVDPPREAVLLVPGALTVPKQYESIHG